MKMTRPNLILPMIAALSAAAPAAVASGAADSPARVADPGDAATAHRQPFITHNPDGTITIQMAPSSAKPGVKEGLVIPPQIVVPLLPPR
jgi:hypothetical protein